MIFKLKRKLALWARRELFYMYLWVDDWLKRNPVRARLNIDLDDRNTREIDTYTDRTAR